jgi:hypothetical protein
MNPVEYIVMIFYISVTLYQYEKMCIFFYKLVLKKNIQFKYKPYSFFEKRITLGFTDKEIILNPFLLVIANIIGVGLIYLYKYVFL